MLILLIIGSILGLASTIIAHNEGVNSGLEISILLILGILAIFGFYGLFNILLVKMAPQKSIKRKMQIGLSAAIVAFGGEVVQLVGRPGGAFTKIWCIGIIIEIVGWLIIREYFLSVPSYSEFDWKDGINEMHIIIAETGISLYYRQLTSLSDDDFKGDVSVEMKVKEEDLSRRPNTDLVAGGLVGIKGMLSEISGEAGNLSHIEIGEKSLVFFQGKTIMALPSRY